MRVSDRVRLIMKLIFSKNADKELLRYIGHVNGSKSSLRKAASSRRNATLPRPRNKKKIYADAEKQIDFNF